VGSLNSHFVETLHKRLVPKKIRFQNHTVKKKLNVITANRELNLQMTSHKITAMTDPFVVPQHHLVFFLFILGQNNTVYLQ
jgi:hypothetical protein